MLKLEIVLDFERAQKRIDTLQSHFPVKVITRSAFFLIVGCHIPQLSDDDKAWLQEMIDTKVIHRWRCKEREDR